MRIEFKIGDRVVLRPPGPNYPTWAGVTAIYNGENSEGITQLIVEDGRECGYHRGDHITIWTTWVHLDRPLTPFELDLKDYIDKELKLICA